MMSMSMIITGTLLKIFYRALLTYLERLKSAILSSYAVINQKVPEYASKLKRAFQGICKKRVKQK